MTIWVCYDDRYNEWKGDMMSEKRKLDQETVDKMLHELELRKPTSLGVG